MRGVNVSLVSRFAAALLLAIGASSGAYADAGKIRICRYPGLTELLDQKSVLIPAGSHFENSALPVPDGKMRHVVVTAAAVTIGPKPDCAVVLAKETENFVHKPITTRTGQFHEQFTIPGITLIAAPIEDFQ